MTGLDGVEAWARLHASCSRKTLGTRFRVQRECMYPKPATDLGQVTFAIMQWEEKWKCHDVRTRRGREDSRLVEDVGSLGNMSQGREGPDGDETGSDRRKLCEPQGEGGVVHDQQYRGRGGQKEEHVPMAQDHNGASEAEVEDWEDVDEVRRTSACYKCGMIGHFAKDCRRSGKGQGKGKAGPKGKGRQCTGKEVQANLEDTREDIREN